MQKLRDNLNQQLKLIKRDQERVSHDSSENKSFEMMDKLFKLTQEKTRGLEERLVACEMSIKQPQGIGGI